MKLYPSLPNQKVYLSIRNDFLFFHIFIKIHCVLGTPVLLSPWFNKQQIPEQSEVPWVLQYTKKLCDRKKTMFHFNLKVKWFLEVLMMFHHRFIRAEVACLIEQMIRKVSYLHPLLKAGPQIPVNAFCKYDAISRFIQIPDLSRSETT